MGRPPPDPHELSKYQQQVCDFMTTKLPDDVTFIVLVQQDGEALPTMMTNVEDRSMVAKAFRDLARGLAGDA